MKTLTPILLTVVAASLWISNPSAKAGELIFSQRSDNQSTYGPSQSWPASGVNSELADDFDVMANIDRVSAGGFVWGATTFQGVYVRFYEFGADNKPGALQREYFFAPGDPNVSFDSLTGAIDATLSPGFGATGRHFLSVQPVINYWYWWSANINAPRGQAFYFRNNAAAGAWQHGDNLNVNVNADLTFDLYGTVSGPGVIGSLSANSLPRSGFLEISGSNFGGSGTVFVGGISAPVADWSSTRIVAYVPETAPLATLSVQVLTSAGASNTKSLAVTTRPVAAARVDWRFRMAAPYSEVRPVPGPDRTVYAIDAFAHLYALAPDGALKWLVRGAGDKGVAVGADGTVYVASESFIKAFNPDGTAKWSFVQNPRAFICLGISVGPDGNIYAVSTEGLGVFSLTPAGAVRWTSPETYDRRIVDYGEIVFGRNGSSQQLYFSANNHLRALRLDGVSVFAILGAFGQSAVAPDGSVHLPLGAYSAGGILLWTFPTPYPYNVFTPPDLASDGTHYFVQNMTQLFALNANGSQRWHATFTSSVDGPIVDPFHSQLVMGSAGTLDHAGFVLAASATDGRELWRVTLPAEDPTVFNSALGIYGFNQFVSTRARFSADGLTAYLMTATATGDNNTSRSFVYALNAGNGTPPAPTPTPTPRPTATPTPAPTPTPPPTANSLRSASITLSADLQAKRNVVVTGLVAVKDQKGATVSGATVATAWKLPNGTTQNQTGNTSTKGTASFTMKAGAGTYTVTVTNITKAGYTFDAVNSILTKSITK